MSYFKNFPLVKYKFGDEKNSIFFQNLTVYVDIIDAVADNVAFYQNYEIIDGDRPDTLSYKLYGTSEYYWTFFILNDHLRESGWPIPYMEIDDVIDKMYPNYVIRLDNLTTNGVAESTLDPSDQKYFGNVFKPGQIITSPLNAAVLELVILDRNLDIGSFTVNLIEQQQSWIIPEEVLAITNVFGNNGFDPNSVYYKEYTSSINSITVERDAVHHYELEGDYYDIDPFDFSSIPVNVVPVTNAERIFKENEKLKTIRILKPNSIEQIVNEFNRLVKS